MMSNLRSVLLGLAAVLISGVFEMRPQGFMLKTKTRIPRMRVTVRCDPGGPGYVAASCECSGACLGECNRGKRACRATKTAGMSATIAATCVMAAASNYYVSNDGTCTRSDGDMAVACNLKVGTPEDEVMIDENGDCVTECEDCTVQALCMKSMAEGEEPPPPPPPTT